MQTPIFICNALVIHIHDIMVLSTDLAVALINYRVFIFIINLLLNSGCIEVNIVCACAENAGMQRFQTSRDAKP
jgi:hypothetical protein